MPDAACAPSLIWSSERTLRISLGDAIGDEAHQRVRAALRSLRTASIDGLIDAAPAYTTIMLTFDPRTLDAAWAEAAVSRALARVSASDSIPAREIIVPVCYDGDCAPDLANVAEMHGISSDEVLRLHCGTLYTAQFIGFAPGFAYLAGLRRELETPRLARPRVRVPEGSVGIAGLQTGVYPRATPGGWQIIGRTPLTIFNAARPEPALITAGDRVRFHPITRADFDRIASEQAAT